MTRTCMFKFLKGHIEYLAQRLQHAKCIAKEENVIMKPTPGKVWIYHRQSVGKKNLMIHNPPASSQLDA